jgi:hypothetical protein
VSFQLVNQFIFSIQCVYCTVERLFMVLIFHITIAILKSLFFLNFLNVFWLAGIYVPVLPKRYPGNFSPRVFVAQREGGGMLMEDNTFGVQTHVPFLPLYPKEPRSNPYCMPYAVPSQAAARPDATRPHPCELQRHDALRWRRPVHLHGRFRPKPVRRRGPSSALPLRPQRSALGQRTLGALDIWIR